MQKSGASKNGIGAGSGWYCASLLFVLQKNVGGEVCFGGTEVETSAKGTDENVWSD